MRASRGFLAVSSLCLVVALTACSGDSDESAGAEPGSAASSSTQASSETNGCRAEVEVTGAVQDSWTGKATVTTMDSGPAALYRASHGKTQVNVYAAGDDFPTSANVSQGEQTFTTPQGDETGVDAQGSGKGATVDADAAGVDPGSKVHLTATFTC
jgi:hypothetical protein